MWDHIGYESGGILPQMGGEDKPLKAFRARELSMTCFISINGAVTRSGEIGASPVLARLSAQ
ncbi:hypothetical protein BHG40_20035 [Aeromonas salmonicida subsp. masoucida]|nr:hypothetical protein CE462_16720 [Aeromonas salmonicida]ATD39961.1 hypothetical protein BHG40_20035 [Aeromonas salmonicida subsp. masoucida]KYN72007.1 hypothetical protein UC38_19415 [Aeromonas salmonicida subsp. salmonicida]OKA73026.1 hypothetical protein BHR41_20275 [Aeromonas salmonicida subsp. salmonicida]OKA98761.1 hypothetical protein BHR46_19730 [Aeromonas salmonicida subsp. salmonicida]